MAAGWAGYAHGQLGQRAQAEKALDESLRELEQLSAEFPREATYRRDLANFVGRYGVFLAGVGEREKAKLQYERSVALLRSLLEESPRDQDARFLLGWQLSSMASLSSEMGAEDAEQRHQEAIRVRAQLAKDFPKRPDFQFDLALSQVNLGTWYLRHRDYARMEQIYGDALRALAAMPAPLQASHEYRRTLGSAHLNLAVAYSRQNQPERAAAEYESGIGAFQRLVNDFPENASYREQLADARANAAMHFAVNEQFAKAVEHMERAVLLYEQLATAHPNEPRYEKTATERRAVLEELKKTLSGESTP